MKLESCRNCECESYARDTEFRSRISKPCTSCCCNDNYLSRHFNESGLQILLGKCILLAYASQRDLVNARQSAEVPSTRVSRVVYLTLLFAANTTMQLKCNQINCNQMKIIWRASSFLSCCYAAWHTKKT